MVYVTVCTVRCPTKTRIALFCALYGPLLSSLTSSLSSLAFFFFLANSKSFLLWNHPFSCAKGVEEKNHSRNWTVHFLQVYDCKLRIPIICALISHRGTPGKNEFLKRWSSQHIPSSVMQLLAHTLKQPHLPTKHMDVFCVRFIYKPSCQMARWKGYVSVFSPNKVGNARHFATCWKTTPSVLFIPQLTRNSPVFSFSCTPLAKKKQLLDKLDANFNNSLFYHNFHLSISSLFLYESIWIWKRNWEYPFGKYFMFLSSLFQSYT